MSYTRHNWIDPETIDAAKLNNIEDGIEEAAQSSGGGGGGDKLAVISLSATGFSSSSRSFGYIVFAAYDDVSGHWGLINDNYGTDNFLNIYGWAYPAYLYLPPVPVPNNEGYAPFLIPAGVDDISVTGDISDTPVTLYMSYGSVVPSGAYRISGSGSITFIAV